MVDEKGYLIANFKQNFSGYKDKNIAIYGLGQNTKVLLDAYADYNIIALMDHIREGEVFWGLPVVSCKQAHDMGVDIILIVARSANVPIIYQRIKNDCEKYNFDVYDINGINQRNACESDMYVCPDEYSGYKKTLLMEKILSADVVSFDVFDTLLMRQTLYPTDVFYIVERKARAQKLLPPECDFAKERIKAERELYTVGNPTIYDIYDKMAVEHIIEQDVLAVLMKSEIEEELNQLCPRKEMQEIVEYARRGGKLVCYTSDMYLPDDIISDFLNKNGYGRFDDGFVSCEYGVAKYNGLFSVLTDRYKGKKILHIGDNYEADIKAAGAYGINDTFYVPSGLKMLMDSPMRDVLQYGKCLPDRQAIGGFVSRYFHDPFLFERTAGRCIIKDCYQMGYDFIEPILAVFVDWMLTCAKRDNIDLIMLGSRDGWIIKKLLDIFYEGKQRDIEYKYIYMSRGACTLAGIKDEKDIEYAASLAFSGKPEEMLRRRFKLQEDEIKKRNDSETDASYILRHSDIILSHSAMYRKGFLQYLDREDIRPDRKVALFDFVSSGTCQMWLEKIMGRSISGFYFVRIHDPKKEALDIQSLFEEMCVYKTRIHRIQDNYFFMENILSSFEPSLACILPDGQMQFEEESRNRKQMAALEAIHRGICDAYRKRISEAEGYPQKELADMMLSFVKNKYSIMLDDYFSGNILKDEFCNREFDINAMIQG